MKTLFSLGGLRCGEGSLLYNLSVSHKASHLPLPGEAENKEVPIRRGWAVWLPARIFWNYQPKSAESFFPPSR